MFSFMYFKVDRDLTLHPHKDQRPVDFFFTFDVKTLFWRPTGLHSSPVKSLTFCPSPKSNPIQCSFRKVKQPSRGNTLSIYSDILCGKRTASIISFLFLHRIVLHQRHVAPDTGSFLLQVVIEETLIVSSREITP